MQNNYILSNVAAERAVLAGLFHFGSDAYFDIADIINVKTFTLDSNQLLFHCVKSIIEKDEKHKIDIPSIYAVGESLGYTHILSKRAEVQHLNGIISLPIELKNVRKFAAQIRKLEITRLLTQKLEQAKEKLLDIDGTEKINAILGIAEDAIFDFSSLLNDKQEGPEILGTGINEYIKHLADNPREYVGIPTGLGTIFDEAIGGGLRIASVNMIGARAKQGKSLLCDHIALYIAQNTQTPVLVCDTEMLKDDHIHRMLGSIAEVSTNDIEKGKFGQNPASRKKVFDAAKTLEKLPYYYQNISGCPIEDILSIMRRWLVKTVGFNDDGSAKTCVIIYDYLKLMSAGEMGNIDEFQKLGFMLTAIHNFAVRYKIPIVLFCQLNRDGLTKEDISAVAGSDRISWFCTNFSIYKSKTDEEIAEDGPEHGQKKLVTVLSRHGSASLSDGDYLNIGFKPWCTKIIPGKAKSQIKAKSKNNYQVVDHQEDVPFA
jgi:replicative DNA helicase